MDEDETIASYGTKYYGRIMERQIWGAGGMFYMHPTSSPPEFKESRAT
jgi:hypothetical protein